MEAKWPEGMTAADLLRWCVNEVTENEEHMFPSTAMLDLIMGEYASSVAAEKESFLLLADQIDKEIKEASEGSECIPLPVDEDGNPWRVGDKAILYVCDEVIIKSMTWDGTKWRALFEWCNGEGSIKADLTSCRRYIEPDTQEKINADALKPKAEYWRCSSECYKGEACPALDDGKTPRLRYGVDLCIDAQILDLLRRQRELDARNGGEE